MTTKQWYDFLDSIRMYDNKIRRLKYTLAELRSCALPRGGSDGAVVQHSRTGSQVERMAERMVLIEKEIDETIELKAEAVMRVDDALRSMPEGTKKTILYDCYVGRISMKKISENIGYSLKHTYRLRKKAIEEMTTDETNDNHSDL